jgi:lipopolysaccharide export system protein LptA
MKAARSCRIGPWARRRLRAFGFGFAIGLGLGLVPGTVALHAQGLNSTFGSSGSGEPLVIEAQEGIEWQQSNQIYIARGAARATKGEVTVAAETLIAHYREIEGGGTEIWRIEATGAVRITTPQETATGDKGIYDIDQGVLVLTGREVSFATPTERITATQSMEYWEGRGLAVARGDAVAIQDDKRLRGDVLSAHLKEDADGKLKIYRVEAFGNVEVKSETEIVRAQYGDYNLESGIATLTGSVKITNGQNQLNGDYAEVDLNTGISRLLARPNTATGESGQVHGIFVPKEKPEQAP